MLDLFLVRQLKEKQCKFVFHTCNKLACVLLYVVRRNEQGSPEEIMSTAAIEEREFETILGTLSEPLPDTVVKQRIGWRDSSGEERWVDYIEWYTAADILDRVCPDWSHE